MSGLSLQHSLLICDGCIMDIAITLSGNGEVASNHMCGVCTVKHWFAGSLCTGMHTQLCVSRSVCVCVYMVHVMNSVLAVKHSPLSQTLY